MKTLASLENEFSVGKAAAIIGLFTLLAKLVALFRDPLIISKIGVGDLSDVYFSAFRLPDFIFNLLVLGTLSVALIPVLSEWLLKDKQKANRIANSVLNLSFLGMAAICLALFAFSSALTKLLVPGFTGEKLLQTTQMMRLFLLSPVIFTLSNAFSSILSSHKKFLILSLAPVLYNLGIIFGLFVFYPRFGLIGLGWGVILGALLHMSAQLLEARRYGFSWRPVVDWHSPELKKIFKLFLPRVIGMDISQVSLIIATTVGSILTAGSVTIFTAANNLAAVPLGIFALSVAAASFPLLSEHFAANNQTAFLDVLKKNITDVLFFMVPLSVLMIIFRAFIVRLIYGHGNFSWDNTIALFTVFGILTLSLIAQSLSPLFSRSFYARQNTIIPVMVNACSIVLDAVLAYILGKKFGLLGIAWGFAIACTFDSLLMFICLRYHLIKEGLSLINFDRAILAFIAKILGASVIMGFAGYGALYFLASRINTETTIGILIQSAIAGTFAGLVFLFSADSFGLSQARGIMDFFRRKG